METTKVIFRKYKEGDVIAIFPEELGTNDPHTCSCYQHMGQHGSCDPSGVISCTKRAKPEEYANLAKELRSIGYSLSVIHRLRDQHLQTRRKMLHELYGKLSLA